MQSMRNAVEGISRGISADIDGESCELRIENKHEQRSEITDVQRRQRYRVYVGKFLRVGLSIHDPPHLPTLCR